MANKYIMAVTCPVCGNIIQNFGYTYDMTCPDGVVLLDSFANEWFECKECETIVSTPSLNDMCSYEEA